MINLISVIVSLLLTLNYSFAQEQNDAACTALSKAIPIAVKLYGLEEKKPISCQSLDESEFQRAVVDMLSKQYAEKELIYEEKTFKMLGLVAHDYPYRSCLLQATAQDTSAFYDPKKAKIILPAFKKTSPATLVHEVVHALQDQHFDLMDYSSLYKESTDRSMAAAALAEGEAARVEDLFLKDAKIDHGASAVGTVGTECNIPATINELFSFGYVYGKKFVDYKIKTGRQAELSQMWKERAVYNSAQFFIYRKVPHHTFSDYAQHMEEFKEILLPRHPESMYQNALGQYGMLTLFKHKISHKTAALASVNLIGDFLILEKSNSHHLLYWHTLWPDRTAAEKFKLVAREYFTSMNTGNTTCDAIMLSTSDRNLTQCKTTVLE